MQPTDFITSTRYQGLPAPVREHLSKIVLDAFAAMIAGSAVPATHILARYAAEILPGKEATVVGTGNVCNPAGAALANACAANALDIDDGFRPAKGHPGAVILPAALAQAQAIDASGSNFLTAVVVGYEIGLRASLAWHTHPHRAPSYHGSGSWGSLGAAAACAHLLRLDADQTAMALGIAEYHAPIAPILTCVQHPAMVKDGVHWGAFVGVTAARLAAQGFTGIPTILKSPEQARHIQSLGKEWWIGRVYYKFHPCCRWTQPAIAGALALRKQHGLTPETIASVRIHTFEAATHLSTRRPTTTEQAQYSLPYPVACAFARGQVGTVEVTDLSDPHILALSDRIEMEVDPEIESRFPAQALARVTVRTTGGRKLCAGPLPASGDAGSGVTFDDLAQKCRRLIGEPHTARLIHRVLTCADTPDVDPLAQCLATGTTP